MNKRPRILVAMSGGVDSAVAAGLLIRQGHEVTGAFMVNYDEPDEAVGVKCWTHDYQDALRVAAKLGIKLLKLNFTEEYRKNVLDYLFREYAAGRTPNPDVMCNKLIKFGVWLTKARELGFDKMATGHYAGVAEKNGQYFLRAARDEDKDQTYFLHQLNQEQLSRVLFPLAKYKKTKVKKLARRWGLPVADKEESMGICLVGDVPMRKFLQKHITGVAGPVILSGGDVIAAHEGLHNYTIGQKYGLPRQNTSGGQTRALFVIDKDIEKNELTVGFDDDPALYKKDIAVKDMNWVAGQVDKIPLSCYARLRHRQPLQKCKIISQDAAGGIRVVFVKKQRAVAPGQFAVFYRRGICLGGGEVI